MGNDPLRGDSISTYARTPGVGVLQKRTACIFSIRNLRTKGEEGVKKLDFHAYVLIESPLDVNETFDISSTNRQKVVRIYIAYPNTIFDLSC